MKDAIMGAVIAALAAASGYLFYLYEQAKANTGNPPTYGELSQVNRTILVDMPIHDRCTASDRMKITLVKWGKATIDFEWQFKAGYGFDIPVNYNWQVAQTSPGVFTIKTPELKQLYPIYIEFTKVDDRKDEASGDLFQKIHTQAIEAARERLRHAIDYKVENDRKLMSDAKASAEKSFKKILVGILGADKVNSVTVDIPQPTSSTKLIQGWAC